VDAVPADLKARLGRWETLTVLLLVVAIVYGSSTADGFVSGQNLNSVLSDVVEIALISLPMTLIIIAAEIDLSVASILGLTSSLIGYLWNHNWPMQGILPVVLIVGGLLGAVNGVLITRLGLPSLAVTIGTMGLYRGLAFVLLGDQAVTEFPNNFLNWGQGTFAGTQIPNPIVLFVVLAVIFGIVLHRTPIGRSIFAIGANDEAARFAGLRVKRIKFWLYVVSGVISAVAGIVFTFRFGSARGDNATGLELSVVACVLLGGVSIFGGRGNLLGVIVAVFLLGVIRNALTLNNVSSDTLTIVTGGLLLLSVLGPSVTARVREALRRGATASPTTQSPSL
jgi:rhamnose transport system permease protein